MATWYETVERFSRVTDKLGKKIDTGILETVTALNMLGVCTKQSCEGHLEWGLPYPWIDIQPEIEQKFLLHRLLLQFYTDRTMSFDSTLIFHGYRLRSVGAAFAELLSEAERMQKLVIYQAEMRAFTIFLKSLVA